MSQQQTVLRVETNIVDFTYQVPIPVAPFSEDRDQYKFTTLDLYGDIPIKINKSIAEIQDISKRNSDLSIGLTLPGSKKNNRFFETFYNVDTQSLYFDPTSRVGCNVLLNDESYFQGYLRLNKINVLNSKVEYDVTLYSTVGNLFGEIGNNLLQDLDFDDDEYTFNHVFTLSGVTSLFGNSNFYRDSEYPYTYFYPIVHNGYEYTNVTGTTGGTSSIPLPNFTGVTSGQTRLYTSTSPISSFASYTAATSAGVEEYRINSPIYGLRDNQLKPGLNVWSLIKLMFKTYGYTIKSDFMNTPWMKSLYLYGYFSYEGTKFGWKVNNIQQLPPSGVAVYFANSACYVVKLNTGIPCFCTEDINVSIPYTLPSFGVEFGTIKAGTSGYTYVNVIGPELNFADANNGAIPQANRLSYLPKKVGDTAQYSDGDSVTFDLVIDQNIKQIDLLSSIAKKFNLVFIADPDLPNQIIVEPYDFYIGSGDIFDWTPKLSWDKGFTVEPAQNFIESNLLLTDLEDGDEGNREFKNRVNRIYGQNVVYNPTDFKSQEKKIDTIFSPELIRRWDENIGLPLGINYSATSEIDKVDNQVRWQYKGVKTKPKLFYWVGTANPFIDDVGEVYSTTGTSFNTYTVKVANSNYTGSTIPSAFIDVMERIPVVSHTMPIGLSDSQKINNDSLSILFNSELPVDIGVQTFNTYTENDVYNTFYRTRINNIYNPNTRLVSGYFDLKYSDIQNFQWNDVIKINEQYFTINKINEFNLTNRELTKVELIQFNLNPQQYVDRYFKYTYCDQPSYCFKLKTDFTNPNLQDTNFIWSTYYDQQVGSLTGTTTGFTSTFRIFNTGSAQVQYVPYTMEEITETDYVSGSCYNSSCDTMLNYIYGNVNGLNFSLASFWENSADTFTGTNLWSNCAGFNATNSTYVITTGSSTTYGNSPCLPTPTPLPTSSPTPTPTSTITPTPTATSTPTITPLPCTTYEVNYTGATTGATIQYTNCTGGTSTELITGLILLSALLGTITCISGDCAGLNISIYSTPTPTPTATSTPTPSPTPTTIPPFIPTGSLFYYDPGNVASYPASGSIMYDLSGNGRNATINGSNTWVSGSMSYFNLTGSTGTTIGYGITGATLNQNLSEWTMWVATYLNTYDPLFISDGFMMESNGQPFNGLTDSNEYRFSIVVEGSNISEPGPQTGSLRTNEWMFLAGAIDSTTYIRQNYKSGSIANPFVTGSDPSSTSVFNNSINLGEFDSGIFISTINGRIGPALMYDRKLTTTELTGINNYFKSRYGL